MPKRRRNRHPGINSARGQVDAWLADRPDLAMSKSSCKNCYDISNGGWSQNFQCACLSRNSKGLWMASHNAMLPDEDPAYKFKTPQKAWEWYQGLVLERTSR